MSDRLNPHTGPRDSSDTMSEAEAQRLAAEDAAVKAEGKRKQ